ncbi:FmdE family protein [Chloroflexota bacterium]
MAETSNNLAHGLSPIEHIGPYTWEEFLERINSFHSYAAPGVIIGGIMVDMAMCNMPEGVLFEVICETSFCLPDSVQLLTPCTTGNGWLKVLDLGRYAINLYDKYNGNGVRVYLDPKKLKCWDEIQAWFLRTKTKSEQNGDLLQQQIRTAGRDIYTLKPVKIKPQYLTKRPDGAIGICSMCGEAYPIDDGTVCQGCQGKAPY